MKENIENFNSKKIFVRFIPEDEEKLNKIIKDIQHFGGISKKVTEKLFINNLDSLIINHNKKYNKILKSWINPDNIIEAELLYRLTRDGDTFSKFHELCDDKGSTLTIFNVNDENIGGIYTPLSWNPSKEEKYDRETFMFNLSKGTKYKNIHKKISIFCTKSSGPWTYDFGFNKSMNKIEHRGINIDNSYEKGSEILPNNSNEIKFFDAKEVEIYKISLINDD